MDITPQEAKGRLDKGEKIIIVDVRSQEEHNEKFIPESIVIPVEAIDKEAAEKLKNKSATIFVYCENGGRSSVAEEVLTLMGYENVFNLGGINTWPYDKESIKQ